MAFNEKKVRKDLRRRTGGRGHSKKLRTRNRDPKGEEVIRVYVEEKLPLEELSSRELIPNELDGIPTDVEKIGVPRAASLKKRRRPLEAGLGIGNMNITVGTLCYFFEKITAPGIPLLASNAHVFSDTIRPIAFEKRVVQPGSRDGGEAVDLVGHLAAHTPLWRPLNPFNALWMVLVNLTYARAHHYWTDYDPVCWPLPFRINCLGCMGCGAVHDPPLSPDHFKGPYKIAFHPNFLRQWEEQFGKEATFELVWETQKKNDQIDREKTPYPKESL